MDDALTLSHLPFAYSHEENLVHALKNQTAPPTTADIIRVLREKTDGSRLWREINTAQHEAKLTSRLLRELKIDALDFWSPCYPEALRAIQHPPWVLYYVGKVPQPHPILAIVGTRNPSSYGVELVAKIVPALRTRPLQIVSGLALGIDGLAHFHSCECGIPNFAILGCGIDRIYPEAHGRLAERILREEGGILSEFPPGTQAYPSHFPRRNRIISGLSDVVWIVQGAAKSGSYHTARHALDQNKEIAACPGDIFAELSAVPHRLIKEGAHPILAASDLDSLLKSARATIAR